MGVTVFASGISLDFDMGYGGFYHLRKNIALALDQEFGEHYANILDTLHASKSEKDAYWKKYEEIINRKNLRKNNLTVLSFLLKSDCGGKISWKTCKKIYDLIKDVDFEDRGFRYAAHRKNDYEDFKKFLRECVKNKRYMQWF